jgi:hypothetical protein
MKDIAPYTKLKPEERVGQTTRLVDDLNSSGRLKVAAAPIRVRAFQLNQPFVRMFGNMVVKNNGDGNMNIRDKLRFPVNFKDYVIVYSYGKQKDYDDGDADALVNILQKASGAFGVSFAEPGFITCDQNVNSWKN